MFIYPEFYEYIFYCTRIIIHLIIRARYKYYFINSNKTYDKSNYNVLYKDDMILIEYYNLYNCII